MTPRTFFLPPTYLSVLTLGQIIGVLLVLCSAASVLAEDPQAAGAPAGEAFHLQGDVQVLPIIMVREFVFVPAEINGIKGKLMFDSGLHDALFLNEHLVPMDKGQGAGRSFTQSGQTAEVSLHAHVDAVSLGAGLNYAQVPGVYGQNLDYLEKITPDCIGQIGYRFFEGYLFKLDYQRRQLTFYRSTDERIRKRDFLVGEKVMATVPFQTRTLPNIPIVTLKIGGIDFVGAFDTGQSGELAIREETQTTFTKAGLLSRSDQPGEPTYNLSGIELTTSQKASMASITVINDPYPAAEPLGIPTENILMLGYAFLSQYATVWDFQGQTLYLLEK